MTIKHIVINGGGPNMWYMYGALKHLHDEGFFYMKNIENIYATSAGALLMVIIILIKDWEQIDNFLINCSWNNYINLSIDNFLVLFKKKGIYDNDIYKKIMKSLLEINNLTVDITLKDFYDFCNINIYFYCSNLNQFNYSCISNTTNPSIPLLSALQMTSAVPLLVEPVLYNKEYYFDGALFYNYPLKPCVDNKDINPDEILALKNMENSFSNSYSMNEKDTFFDYVSIIFKNFIAKSDNTSIQPKIKNEIHLMFQSTINYEYWNKILSENKYREQIKQDGIKCAKLFILYY